MRSPSTAAATAPQSPAAASPSPSVATPATAGNNVDTPNDPKERIELARKVGAKRTYFTHVSHDLDHESTNAELPEGMLLAHDGLKLGFEIPDGVDA